MSIRCAPLDDQRICWLAPIRRCSNHCTVLSVVAVDIGSSLLPYGRIVDDQIGLPGHVGLETAKHAGHLGRRHGGGCCPFRHGVERFQGVADQIDGSLHLAVPQAPANMLVDNIRAAGASSSWRSLAMGARPGLSRPERRAEMRALRDETNPAPDGVGRRSPPLLKGIAAHQPSAPMLQDGGSACAMSPSRSCGSTPRNCCACRSASAGILLNATCSPSSLLT